MYIIWRIEEILELAITKKNIELHAATISNISEYINRLSSETDEVTIASIRDENRRKIKTFDSDLGESDSRKSDESDSIGFDINDLESEGKSF